MTRSDMINEIAKQAHCSKRLVRKKLFQRSAEFRRNPRYKHVKFNQAFLDKNTDWNSYQEIHDKWKNKTLEPGATPWTMPNLFDVAYFPSGCVIMMRINVEHYEEGCIYIDQDWVGARLYGY